MRVDGMGYGVMLWRSVLLVEETTDLSQGTDKLKFDRLHPAMKIIRSHNFSGDEHLLYM